MGLIIKREIQKLLPGYPTVSDKYNVQGGVLASDSADAYFGTALLGTAVDGAYKAAASVTASSVLAGILLATNVKLAGEYPAGPSYRVKSVAGEEVNCMIEGFIAVPTAITAAGFTGINAGTPVDITAAGAFTANGTSSDFNIKGAYYTGVAEVKDLGGVATVVAEIYLPMVHALEAIS